MANIKGENLRIFIYNKCVGAATNANVHIQLNVGESGTKDDVEGWAVNEPQGLLWDAQVDAMIIERPEPLDSAVCSEYVGSGYGYRTPNSVHLQKGDGIAAYASSQSATVFILQVTSQGLVSKASGTGQVGWTATAECDVYVSSDIKNQAINYEYGDNDSIGCENFLGAMFSDTQALVKFATTTPGVDRNRNLATAMLQGYAYVSDINIVAQNQDVTTYSCKLTGTGTLENLTEE